MSSRNPPVAAAVAWPLQVEILPDGKLSARIHHHSMTSVVSGTFNCWTFISQGLLAVKQKELVFTVRQRTDEQDDAIPNDPINWFKLIYDLAAGDRPVDSYGLTEFNSSDFFGRADIQEIVYAPNILIEGLPGTALPPQRLQAIILTKTESEIAKKDGLWRVRSSWAFREMVPIPTLDRSRSHGLRDRRDIPRHRSTLLSRYLPQRSVRTQKGQQIQPIPYKDSGEAARRVHYQQTTIRSRRRRFKYSSGCGLLSRLDQRRCESERNRQRNERGFFEFVLYRLLSTTSGGPPATHRRRCCRFLNGSLLGFHPHSSVRVQRSDSPTRRGRQLLQPRARERELPRPVDRRAGAQ